MGIPCHQLIIFMKQLSCGQLITSMEVRVIDRGRGCGCGYEYGLGSGLEIMVWVLHVIS
jgi:hypothetical protein